MFSAPGGNFGCYLQCFLPPEQISVAICNVFCLWNKFRLLLACFVSAANFVCYLQICLPLGPILNVTCNVRRVWSTFWGLSAMCCAPEDSCGCHLHFCHLWGQVCMLFAMFFAFGANVACYLPCLLGCRSQFRFTGLPEARTGQKNIGGAPDKKNSTGQKQIRCIGAGRRRIVF